jgi:hypothetical protein
VAPIWHRRNYPAFLPPVPSCTTVALNEHRDRLRAVSILPLERDGPFMARQPPVPQSRNLSPRDIETAIERLDRRVAELNAWDISTVSKRNDPRVDELEAAIADTLVSTFGDATPEYNIYRQARDLDTARHNYAFEVPWHEIAEGFSIGKERAIRLLSQYPSVSGRLVDRLRV